MTLQNRKKSFLIIASVILLGLLTISAFILPNIYNKYFKANINVTQKTFLYIPSKANFKQVLDSIATHQLLIDSTSFLELAEERNLSTRFKSGKYAIKNGMNNRQILNMLIAGNQEPVDLSFRNIRLKQNFAAFVAKKLEFDSLQLINLLDSTEFIKKYGFNKENIYTMFIPDSYQMYWNINSEDFFNRMNKEYLKFWNEERLAKAAKLNLNTQQISILASIVDAEALVDREMPIIAGLYLNRLNKGIKLEADPTVIFANNDFSIRRVLNKHLTKDSPYNTYVNLGLPPGPIMMPSINAIDAVLNRQSNDYIYMCAKEDLSGTHNFATNLSEHLRNAKKFQNALNQRNIKK
jgi:UPF0755 protein